MTCLPGVAFPLLIAAMRQVTSPEAQKKSAAPIESVFARSKITKPSTAMIWISVDFFMFHPLHGSVRNSTAPVRLPVAHRGKLKSKQQERIVCLHRILPSKQQGLLSMLGLRHNADGYAASN